MNIRKRLILTTFLIAGFSSSYVNGQESQWGRWAIDDNGISYGSGVTGTDENLLHQLDQSSLLDYQAELEQNSLATGIEAGIDSTFSSEPTDSDIDNIEVTPIEQE